MLVAFDYYEDGELYTNRRLCFPLLILMMTPPGEVQYSMLSMRMSLGMNKSLGICSITLIVIVMADG